jgi:WD40 repeat protein
MPSESSNPDCSPPTEPQHTPVEVGSSSALSVAPTQPPELEFTALAANQSLTAPRETPTSRTQSEVGTVEGARSENSWSPFAASRFPRLLGEYELLGEISRGGMGVVYRARQDKLDRLVAVKLIRAGSLAGEDDLRRFRQEAKAMAELDHPHIIPIYEIGQEDDQPYFSMKLIEGGNLTRHVERFKHEPRTVAGLIAKVARAVHFAHQRGILHRDIKPSNILLGEHDEPYVMDFGLAKRIGPESGPAATVPGAVMGTPAYMPPEQARVGTKSVTTAADIYSLGATLYEALTGQPPFRGDSIGEIMRQVLDQEPARPRSINPKLDRDLETICLKCLEKAPARRYGSAEALAEDLDRWLTGMPITARPVPAWERAVKWVKRRPALATLVVMLPLALLGFIGGGIWFTLRLGTALDLAERGRYAANMNLARRALEDGLIYQVREQLNAYRTGPGDLRSFEWHYLANLCEPAPIRLRGHENAVICVALHPDESRVVSGGTDGTVRIWDLSGSQPPQVLNGAGGSVHCVAVSPDGHWLAAGDSGGGLRLWELETTKERSLGGHKSGLRSVAFSPDGDHLLSCEVSGLIKQWNVRTGGHEFDLRHSRQEEKSAPIVEEMYNSRIYRGAMATYAPPDGQTIVSVGLDQWVMIWDVATQKLRDEVPVGVNILGFSINRDGRELALGEEATGIEILNLQKPHDPRRRVPGVNRQVSAVAFSPIAGTLAIAGFGGRGGLLDVRSGQFKDLFDDRVNFSPSGLAFGKEGRMLAMAVADEVHVVRVERSQNGATVATGLGPVLQLAVSPDARLLALGRENGTIVVWDLSAGRVIQTLSGHGPPVFDLDFVAAAQGMRLVSVGGDGLIKIWDPEAGGEPMLSGPGRPAGAVYSVAVRTDGRQFATGGEDGMVRTWDPETGKEDLPPLDHGASISALAYDPTGTALASGGMDCTVRVWSATSGRRRLGPLTHTHQLTSLAFSPDARLLAGGGGAVDSGGSILIWDARSGTRSVLVKCPRGVDSMSFSPDSLRIATCGSDSVVQVWDAIGGHETLSLDGRGGRVSAVQFAPGEPRLYSAGRDGVIRLWDGSTTVPAR